jgi:hypothetical protein
VTEGVYLRVSCGRVSVPGRLSIDAELDKETVALDQTLRTALYLKRVLQEGEVLIHDPKKGGDLPHPIVIHRSEFPGPRLLARLVKQQYLICNVHNAMGQDMEKPIARLTEDAMKVIGIQPGDKALLIHEKRRKRIRCLALDPNTNKKLPSDTMTQAWPLGDIKAPSSDDMLNLPWITLDRQRRDELGVEPWQPIIVGRDPRHALTLEFTTVAMAVALSGLGGALAIPKEIAKKLPWLGWSIVFGSLAVILTLIGLKIRSRI